MARDLRNITSTFVCEVRNHPSGALGSTGTYTNTLNNSSRNDSISTNPSKTGAYYRPTAYAGRFFLSSGDAFNYMYWNGITFNIWSGPQSPSQLITPDIQFHGVDTSGYPKLNTWLQSLAASKIQNKVRSMEWDLGQDIAESKQTLRFILSPITLLIKLVKAASGNPYSLWNLARSTVITAGGSRKNKLLRYLKNNKRSLISKSGKGAASAWLAYKFAWLPLMSSIYSAVQIMKKGLNSGSPHFSANASVRSPLSPPRYDTRREVRSEAFDGHSEVKIEVNYSLSSVFLNSLEKLGLTNPLSLAWETLPLSFVLDWFIPVGNFLKAISGPMGISYHSGYQTSAVKWNHQVSWITKGNFANVGTFPKNQASRFSFRRDLLLGFPIPVPHFRGLGSSLTWDKSMSLLALAVQIK